MYQVEKFPPIFAIRYLHFMSDFKRIFAVLALTTLGPQHRRDQLHLHRSQL